MSRKLAISSALSVLLMAAYVLLGQQATRVPLAGEPGFGIEVSAPAAPTGDLGKLLTGR